MTRETNESTTLINLKTQQEIAKKNLQTQISRIRRIIDNLENNLEREDFHLSSSDGLQVNSSSIDIYLNQYISYSRAIELFELEFLKNE